jgi:iron complex outermembrane receptor protein
MARLAELAGSVAVLALLPAAAHAQTSDTSDVFEVGQVIVTGAKAPPRPGAQAFLTAQDLQTYETARVSEALTLLPNIHPQPGNRGGARNEQTVYVRGFDQSRTPVLLDGIPIYVPYDGYIDLARLPTFALSGIEVARGYTSVLYGPNALGGAINLVSRRPSKAFEAQANGRIDFDRGLASQGYRVDAQAGILRDRWYLQAGVAVNDRDHYRLSKDFSPGLYQPVGLRRRSASKDVAANVKVAITPNATDEYALTLVWQDADKQAPPYAGTVASNGVFFDWPQYDKRSVYFNGLTALGDAGAIKTRLFYDVFKNSLRRYDDDTYATQRRPFAFTSFYDDYTLGGSLEYAAPTLAAWDLKAALHLKQDVHRENSLNGPVSKMEDRTGSFAVAGERPLSAGWRLFFGASYDWRNAVMAQDPSTNGASRFATQDQSGWNAQAGVTGEVGPGLIKASVSRKVRFATQFERYSYRLGNGLPNPGLKAESAIHYEVGYAFAAAPGLRLDISAFASDFTDIIQTVVVGTSATPPFGAISQSQNLGKAWIKGVELGAELDLGQGRKVRADYAYLDRDLRNRPGLQLYGTPRHTLNLRGELPFGRLSLIPSVLVRSSQTTAESGTGAPIKGYTLAGLKAAWRVSDAFSLEGGVNNLFDKAYQYDLGFPAAGREFFFGIRGRI